MIMARVNHMHQRMARVHGDLSADVPDPVQDWAEKGLTYQVRFSTVLRLLGD